MVAIRRARELKIPYLGLCLGMQRAVTEFAREVCANGMAVFLQNISGRIYSLIMNSTLLALGGANAVWQIFLN